MKYTCESSSSGEKVKLLVKAYQGLAAGSTLEIKSVEIHNDSSSSSSSSSSTTFSTGPDGVSTTTTTT